MNLSLWLLIHNIYSKFHYSYSHPEISYMQFLPTEWNHSFFCSVPQLPHFYTFIRQEHMRINLLGICLALLINLSTFFLDILKAC